VAWLTLPVWWFEPVSCTESGSSCSSLAGACYGMSVHDSREGSIRGRTYLLLDLAGNLRVGGVGNTLAAFVLHIDGCGGGLLV